MKTLILTAIFIFGSAVSAQAQSLGMLQLVSGTANELAESGRFLVTMIRSEGDGDEEAACYALGALDPVVKRMDQQKRFLNRNDSSALSTNLNAIKAKTTVLAQMCSKKTDMGGATDHNRLKSSRLSLANEVMAATDAIANRYGRLAQASSSTSRRSAIRNLNELRVIMTIADELKAQGRFLQVTVGNEGKKNQDAACYALGTLKSSRNQLANKARELGSSEASYIQQYLNDLSGKVTTFAEMCSEKTSVAGARSFEKHKNDRRSMAQDIMEATSNISIAVTNAVTGGN